MRDLLYPTDDAIILSDPDPTRRAQKQMRTPLPKRFYGSAEIGEAESGFAVLLDGKPVRTPGHSPLVLPTAAAARLVADEFAAQGEEIDPVSMPVLRLANSAIDGVSRDVEAVAADILAYAGSDLVLYRAEEPAGLVARQRAAWDPVLDWARERLGAHFRAVEGVMPVTQPPEALEAVRRHLASRQEPFQLAGLHLMTSLMGSALLALRVEDGDIAPAEAWAAAHVDESWNAELWGHDSEAVARGNARKRDMMAVHALIKALKGE